MCTQYILMKHTITTEKRIQDIFCILLHSSTTLFVTRVDAFLPLTPEFVQPICCHSCMFQDHDQYMHFNITLPCTPWWQWAKLVLSGRWSRRQWGSRHCTLAPSAPTPGAQWKSSHNTWDERKESVNKVRVEICGVVTRWNEKNDTHTNRSWNHK